MARSGLWPYNTEISNVAAGPRPSPPAINQRCAQTSRPTMPRLICSQVATVKPRCGLWLAQRAECRADLGREQLGLFPGGEVPAPAGLVEVAEAGIDHL